MSLLVLGLGNDLLGDDGIGLLAADAVENAAGTGVTVLKSALSGLYLVDLVEGYDDLLIVDSVIGEPPGEVVHLKKEEMGARRVPSAHYAGLAEALEIAREAGMKVPERVEIVAMRIRNSQILGTAVSREVRLGLPRLIEEVITIAKRWGYEMKTPTTRKSRKGKAKKALTG